MTEDIQSFANGTNIKIGDKYIHWNDTVEVKDVILGSNIVVVFNFTTKDTYYVPVPDLKPLKDNSAGVKYDSDKLQYTLIPPLALKEVARNLTIGLKKYPERNNWKKVPNSQERYLDALYRHLEAHRAGELFDPDSSVPDMYHLAAVAVNAMFLLEFMLDDELKNKE